MCLFYFRFSTSIFMTNKDLPQIATKYLTHKSVFFNRKTTTTTESYGIQVVESILKHVS